MILFHDIYQRTADAIPLFLPTLYQRGYVCVTVEQLFSAGRGNAATPGFTQFGETNGFDWAY